jgi:Peroxiredoxin
MEGSIKIIEGNLIESIGNQAPDLIFQTITDHNSHRISEYTGKVVLLNFWSRNCSGCRQEMPDISRLQDDYDYAGLKVLYLASLDFESQSHFFDAYKISGTKCFVDNENLHKPYQLFGLPMTILIDRSGFIKDGWFGSIGYDSTEMRVNKLIPHEQKRSRFLFYVFLFGVPFVAMVLFMIRRRATKSINAA